MKIFFSALVVATLSFSVFAIECKLKVFKERVEGKNEKYYDLATIDPEIENFNVGVHAEGYSARIFEIETGIYEASITVDGKEDTLISADSISILPSTEFKKILGITGPTEYDAVYILCKKN